MYPTWGLYGAAAPGPYPPPPAMMPPPPLPGPPPAVLSSALPPQVPVAAAPYAASSSASATAPGSGTSGFLSLQEQHLAQLQQLQQMHQKQLQSVLLGGPPPPPGPPPPSLPPPPLPSASAPAAASWQPPVPSGPPPARTFHKQFKHRDPPPPPPPREPQIRNPPMPPMPRAEESVEPPQALQEWESPEPLASPHMDMDMDLSSPPQSPSQPYMPPLETDPYALPSPPPQAYQAHSQLPPAFSEQTFSEPSPTAASQAYLPQSQPYPPTPQPSSSQALQSNAPSGSQTESRFTPQISQPALEPQEFRQGGGENTDNRSERLQSTSHPDLSSMTPQVRTKCICHL